MTAFPPDVGQPLVRPGTAADVDAVVPLWRRLYEDQTARGMLVRVPADGAAEWAESMRAIVGRFGCLVVSQTPGGIVGFAAGRLRNLPRHFGGASAGFISDVWVEPSARGHGLAALMIQEAVTWFRTQGVRRVELQVIAGNDTAAALYARLGFVGELTQMVREWPD